MTKEIKTGTFEVNLKDLPWAEEQLERYVNDGWSIAARGGDGGKGSVIPEKGD